MIILFALIVLLLSSCSLDIPIPVTLVIGEEHPFEELFSRDLWYTLSYFDGREERTIHIDQGTREITVRVYSGGLRAFSMKPMGELGPIGGFFEPGDDGVVYLKGSSGDLAEQMVSALSYRNDAVERLSMRELLEAEDDLRAIDETEFLSRIYDGTLTSSTIPHKERRLIGFDSIPEGLWVSERYDTPSFAVEMSGDETVFDIYPSAYRYICKERGLLLTVVLTEDGEASASIRESPII